jgi:hypothetical protein
MLEQPSAWHGAVTALLLHSPGQYEDFGTCRRRHLVHNKSENRALSSHGEPFAYAGLSEKLRERISQLASHLAELCKSGACQLT